MAPYEIAKKMIANSFQKGRKSNHVAEWRQELIDLVGEAEAKRLLGQARRDPSSSAKIE